MLIQIEKLKKNLSTALLALLIFTLNSCAQKFNIKELSKSGKIAILSDHTYRIFYVPNPFAEERERKDIEEIEAFLENFPLAKILRQKVYKALINYDNTLNLVSDTTVDSMEDTYLQNFLMWAKKNQVNAIMYLESTIEISYAYRSYSLPLKNYPKIWTKVTIINVKDSKVLWTKRIWTHMFDGTTTGLKSYSAYDTIFNRKYLEILIDRKIDYIVRSLVNSLF
ncbi:MAG: hypothetical protein RMJ67_08700 [Elusimicrobiota bacterium]|nr:hypothetical protein [Endomicrobiia bacterium]MDW8166574.1 hypothetical protein [Elusimicrobiota bacterium]